jgi:hypothetical protein
MALDVWYKADIENALSAAEQACGAALEAAANGDDPFVAGYQAGYRSALVTVGLAFGLVPTPRSRPGSPPFPEGSWWRVEVRDDEAGEGTRLSPLVLAAAPSIGETSCKT